jgi:hypothetical protein
MSERERLARLAALESPEPSEAQTREWASEAWHGTGPRRVTFRQYVRQHEARSDRSLLSPVTDRRRVTATSPLAVTYVESDSTFQSDCQGEAPGRVTAHSRPSGATPGHGLSEDAEILGHVPTVPTRSRKGRTSFRATGRVRVRRAPVTSEHTGLSGLSEPDLIALADDLLRASDDEDGTVRRYVAGPGKSRYLLGGAIRPTMWATITPDLTVTTRKGRREIRDRFYVSGVRPDVSGIAVHTADVAGYLGHTSALDMLRELDTKRDRVHDPKRQPVRMRLHGRLRKSERGDWDTLPNGQHVRRSRAGHGYAGLYLSSPTVVLGWHVVSTHAWHGHVLVKRPDTARRSKVVPMSERTPDRASYAKLAESLAAGLAAGRSSFVITAGTLTVSKGRSGRHSCSLVKANGDVTRWQARSVEAIAARAQ